MTSLLNELKGETIYLYDEANRLVKVQSKHLSQGYEYDELGQLVRQVNGAKEERHFAYDTQGNLIRQQNARGQSLWTEYDDEGHKTKETNALGAIQSKEGCQTTKVFEWLDESCKQYRI